jgi:hypothetical protein
MLAEPRPHRSAGRDDRQPAVDDHDHAGRPVEQGGDALGVVGIRLGIGSAQHLDQLDRRQHQPWSAPVQDIDRRGERALPPMPESANQVGRGDHILLVGSRWSARGHRRLIGSSRPRDKALRPKRRRLLPGGARRLSVER